MTVSVCAVSDIVANKYDDELNAIDASDCDIVILAGDIVSGGGIVSPDWLDRVFIPWCKKHAEQEIVYVPGEKDHFLLGLEHTPEVQLGRLRNVHCLCDKLVELHGIKIYGTPWVLDRHTWTDAIQGVKSGYEVTSAELEKHFSAIPDGVDILVSHAVPYVDKEFVDFDVRKGEHLGSEELTRAIQRAKPKCVICGHVARGGFCDDPSQIGNTSVYNVSYGLGIENCDYPLAASKFDIEISDGCVEDIQIVDDQCIKEQSKIFEFRPKFFDWDGFYYERIFDENVKRRVDVSHPEDYCPYGAARSLARLWEVERRIIQRTDLMKDLWNWNANAVWNIGLHLILRRQGKEHRMEISNENIQTAFVRRFAKENEIIDNPIDERLYRNGLTGILLDGGLTKLMGRFDFPSDPKWTNFVDPWSLAYRQFDLYRFVQDEFSADQTTLWRIRVARLGVDGLVAVEMRWGFGNGVLAALLRNWRNYSPDSNDICSSVSGDVGPVENIVRLMVEGGKIAEKEAREQVEDALAKVDGMVDMVKEQIRWSVGGFDNDCDKGPIPLMDRLLVMNIESIALLSVVGGFAWGCAYLRQVSGKIMKPIENVNGPVTPEDVFHDIKFDPEVLRVCREKCFEGIAFRNRLRRNRE